MVHAETPRQSDQAVLATATHMLGPDGAHIGLGELGAAVGGAFGRDAPTALVSVADIVGVRSDLKVGRIDAKRYVAPVTDDQTIGTSGTALGFAGFAAGLALLAARPDLAVARAVLPRHPEPALIRACESDLLPVALKKVLG